MSFLEGVILALVKPCGIYFLLWQRNVGERVALGSGNISLSIPEPMVVRGINKSLIVSCSAPAAVTWFNPAGNQITASMKGRIHTESNHKKGVSLVLERILKQDKGTYTCKAKMDNKEMSASFELVVINPLSFVDTPTEQTATLHSSVVLRCEVLGDFDPSITWQRDGKTPEGPRYKIVNDGLTIMNTTLADEGEYVCRAFQVSQVTTNTLERHIKLRVEHAPMWLEGQNPNVSYGLVDGDVKLTCAVKAHPTANFKWLRGGRPLTPTTSSVSMFEANNLGVLQLRVHNHSTFGNYSCKARNRLGEVERSMTLVEGTKPHPPTSFTVDPADGDSVSLDIREKEDDTGELDTLGYRVQYRLKGTNTTWDNANYVDFEKGAKPFHISGLVQNMEYEMRVATRNAAGFSDYSLQLSHKNPSAQAEHVSGNGAGATVARTALVLLVRLALLLWL